MSYTPMVEFEVRLRVHAPITEPEPREWDWAGLMDMRDEHVQFKSQRVASTYNMDNDDVRIRTEVVDRVAQSANELKDAINRMAAQNRRLHAERDGAIESAATLRAENEWLKTELARVVPKSGMVQDLESPHSHWNKESDT